MNRKPIFLIALFFLVSISSRTLGVQGVEASGTIYIRADGSIDPPTAPISTLDNVTYILTGNITSDAHGITVERDNVIIDGAGYTLQGRGDSVGIYLTTRRNVTIKNVEIKAFNDGIYLRLHSAYNTVSGNTIIDNGYDGIYVSGSSNNIISENTIENDYDGISLHSSSDNIIYGNTIANNDDLGIYFSSSSNNSISGNTITNSNNGIYFYIFSNNNSISGNTIKDNNECGIISYDPYENNNNSFVGNTIANNRDGIFLSSSSNNTIISGNTITNNSGHGICLSSYNNSVLGNTIANNGEGILFLDSSNNTICNNNFVGNTQQVYDYSWENPNYPSSVNLWNFGYPLGGNYWSNYTGVDSDHDGIGDTPYIIDANNTDHYPLMTQYVIPEFPSFLMLPLFMMVTSLAVILYKRKRAKLSRATFVS
jgi:parallel beta-helix repeat protein